MKCVQITKLVMIQHVWIHVDQLFVGEDPVVPPRLNAEELPTRLSAPVLQEQKVSQDLVENADQGVEDQDH